MTDVRLQELVTSAFGFAGGGDGRALERLQRWMPGKVRRRLSQQDRDDVAMEVLELWLVAHREDEGFVATLTVQQACRTLDRVGHRFARRQGKTTMLGEEQERLTDRDAPLPDRFLEVKQNRSMFDACVVQFVAMVDGLIAAIPRLDYQDRHAHTWRLWTWQRGERPQWMFRTMEALVREAYPRFSKTSGREWTRRLDNLRRRRSRTRSTIRVHLDRDQDEGRRAVETVDIYLHVLAWFDNRAPGEL